MGRGWLLMAGEAASKQLESGQQQEKVHKGWSGAGRGVGEQEEESGKQRVKKDKMSQGPQKRTCRTWSLEEVQSPGKGLGCWVSATTLAGING